MHKTITIFMYLLWGLTILAVFAATFKDFQYEDLNLIALVSFVFAVLNSILALTMNKK
ncbi:MAG TPA: hypothetical protein PLB05_07630 [Candidatus Omnitrophota bacterium]|nr:hypothetical protein [Candidatus Omnitrophota bacterium]HPN56029.1 hypothetical protein [Candidatus Omnitrophota bacterium]